MKIKNFVLNAVKRGRPRKHANPAAKQAAYRRRKQASERKELVALVLPKTRIREGENLADVERKLSALTVRKLKERLREYRNNSSGNGRSQSTT